MSAENDPASPSPQFAYSPSSQSGGAMSSDVGAFLLIGAIGAFLMVGIVGAGMAQMALLRSQSMLILVALLGLGGLVGLGVGMLGLARAANVAQAKAAGIVLFVAAALALLPMVAMMAKSLGMLRVGIMGGMLVGAIAWALVGFSVQSAAALAGTLAKVAGVLLILSAFFDLAMFVISQAKLIKGRSAMETVQAIGYVFAGLRIVGLILTGVVLLQLRGKRA